MKTVKKMMLMERTALTLVQKITAYQSSGDVVVGGIAQAQWLDAGNLGGVSLTGASRIGIYHKSTLSSVNISIQARTGAAWAIRHFRYDYTDFNFLATLAITPAATGVQNFPVTWSVLKGDTVAIWTPAAGNVFDGGPTAAGIGATNYATGNIQADNALATVANINPLLEIRGTRPYMCVVGDSIAAGQTRYNGYFAPAWNSEINRPGYKAGQSVLYEPGYTVEQLISGIAVANFALDGKDTVWCIATGMPKAITSDPDTILVNVGINDMLITGLTYAQFEANLDTLRGLCTTAGIEHVILSEILPDNNASDGQAAAIRAWNASMALWAAANNVTLALTHDAMGQVRVSTGELDDLVTAYNLGDGVHLSEAGAQALGALWAAYIS